MQARRKQQPEERRVATWRYLAGLAREEITRAPAIDDAEWKSRIQARAVETGHRCPPSLQVYRVIDALAPSTRRIRRQPDPPADPPPPPPRNPFPDRAANPTGTFTRIGDLTPPITSTSCGHSKPASGRTRLVCNLERGHAGDHGMCNGGVLFVRWSR